MTESKVEVVHPKTVVTTAMTDEEYKWMNAPVPEDKNACIAEIISSFSAAHRFSTFKFWRIGKIIDILQNRGEKDVMAVLMKKTQYEKRTLQYTLAVFRAFPDLEKVRSLCEKGVEWTHFKQLARVKEDKDRNKLVKSVLADVVEPGDLGDKVKEMKDPPVSKNNPVTTYFAKMSKLLAKTQETLTDMMVEYPAYTELMEDEERTPDSEFTKILGFAKEVVDKATAAIAQIESVRNTIKKEIVEVAD